VLSKAGDSLRKRTSERVEELRQMREKESEERRASQAAGSGNEKAEGKGE
jgi:hypothetical protein